jgi:nucleotide-binding universal stress UspA family protein
LAPGPLPRASIEEVLEDLTEIAAEKGIRLYSVRVRRGRLEGAEVRESLDRYANADTSYLL